MKCYKVVKIEYGKCLSALVTAPRWVREYSTEDLVDMGFVFKNIEDAENWFRCLSAKYRSQIWEASASELQFFGRQLQIGNPYNDLSLSRYWDRKTEPSSMPFGFKSHSGSYIGFDIRLIKPYIPERNIKCRL